MSGAACRTRRQAAAPGSACRQAKADRGSIREGSPSSPTVWQARLTGRSGLGERSTSGDRRTVWAKIFAECGLMFEAPLHRPGAHRMFLPDADLSRKERGHRGVRPRHPETDGPPGQSEEGSSSGSVRVAFVNAPAGCASARARGWRFPRATGRRWPAGGSPMAAAVCALRSGATPRGRQASTWSVRGGGRESRFRAASLITRKNHTCGLSRVRPRRLANTRTMGSRPSQPAAGITGIR